MSKIILALIILTPSILAAKTDLSGCTLTVVPLLTAIVTTTGVAGVQTYGDYAETTFQWDGTEQCQLIDCGGGRAPPKTDAPGCPGYTGTDTVTPLPFPTASLTLVEAGVTSTATAAAANSVTTASPSNTLTSAPSATATNTISSNTPIGTAAAGNVTQTSALNPTASSNSVLGYDVRWNMVVMGLGAVALAFLHLP